jgi:hypothetical protein
MQLVIKSEQAICRQLLELFVRQSTVTVKLQMRLLLQVSVASHVTVVVVPGAK